VSREWRDDNKDDNDDDDDDDWLRMQIQTNQRLDQS